MSIHARPTHMLAILHRQTVQHMCVDPSSWERMGAQILVSTCNAVSSSSLPHVHKNHDNNLLGGQFSSEVRLLRELVYCFNATPAPCLFNNAG